MKVKVYYFYLTFVITVNVPYSIYILLSLCPLCISLTTSTVHIHVHVSETLTWQFDAYEEQYKHTCSTAPTMKQETRIHHTCDLLRMLGTQNEHAIALMRTRDAAFCKELH